MPLFTHELPAALYTAAQTRELDRRTMAAGVAGYDLMTRAGEAAFGLLRSVWPQATRCVVLCGGGNNGGDGYVIARLAQQQGLDVCVLAVTPPERLVGDARLAYESARDAGVSMTPFRPEFALEADVIVDAVLGTGVQGEVKAGAREAIEWINARAVPVLAIDIPSGLCADHGRILGAAVKASYTITFIGLKVGLLSGVAADVVGDLVFASLDVPETIRQEIPPAMSLVTRDVVNVALPRRARDAHKGWFGHVLVVGGDHGMGGAVLMAAQAAARTGAGLTSVATRADHVAPCLARCPELMVHALGNEPIISSLLETATVIVVGPGLGRTPWGKSLLLQVLRACKPAIIDADGLYWLVELLEEQPQLCQGACWVLTPHPGEAARLLRCDTQRVQEDRPEAVRQLNKHYGAVTVLKGAGSLICDQQRVSLAAVGNPGMATGGMGDVLSGIIGGLVAQGLTLAHAANAGVWLHGTAADLAARQGERGMLATDLLVPLRSLINPVS